MALNTFKCNYLTTLDFKGLTYSVQYLTIQYNMNDKSNRNT